MAASNGDGRRHAAAATTTDDDDDDDDLFELDDIVILGRRDADEASRLRAHRGAAAVTDDNDDDGRGHALLANCLLPASSVRNAVPVAAGGGGGVASAPYPCAGYLGSRRLFVTSSSSSRRLVVGRSARSFCFSGRGFETMGTYFQRY